MSIPFKEFYKQLEKFNNMEEKNEIENYENIFDIKYKPGQAIPMDQNGWFIITEDKEKIYYNNKSGIMKNLLISDKEKHVWNGWSIPGQYIGQINDTARVDERIYQKNRVYQDELDILNNGKYRLQRRLKNEDDTTLHQT